MKGLLLYCRQDYQKNKEFATWIIQEFKQHRIEVRLLLKEEFYAEAIDFRQYCFAINRTRDLDISLRLELNRIRVYNHSQITLIGNNKLAGYAYAQRQGYAYAPILLQTVSANTKILAKPNYGHGGEGIRLLSLSEQWRTDEVQQVFMEDAVGDIRFYILQNQIHVAVLRKATSGKITANYSQGGKIERYYYSDKEASLVRGLIGELKIDYAGIDFLLTKQGELIFNEIEDVVGSRMLSHLGINETVPIWVANIVCDLEK